MATDLALIPSVCCLLASVVCQEYEQSDMDRYCFGAYGRNCRFGCYTCLGLSAPQAKAEAEADEGELDD
jgi:hypothetical protein